MPKGPCGRPAPDSPPLLSQVWMAPCSRLSQGLGAGVAASMRAGGGTPGGPCVCHYGLSLAWVPLHAQVLPQPRPPSASTSAVHPQLPEELQLTSTCPRSSCASGMRTPGCAGTRGGLRGMPGTTAPSPQPPEGCPPHLRHPRPYCSSFRHLIPEPLAPSPVIRRSGVARVNS